MPVRPCAPDHLPVTYAVIWSSGREPIHAGRLALLPGAVLLEGSIGGKPAQREIRYGEIAALRIARDRSQRLRDRPVLVIEAASGDSVRVAMIGGGGLLGELSERIGAACGRHSQARPAPA